eukprot:TRINITY_DN2864_c1_g1_i3.p1 TRINITY_DN2864_c1_g1~~TRINITY_DN2864_c1_g1_i3.p1  ORF type:complete len:390 (-),score=77.34 TRINITY_DN2864_c1_g1_i3:112-1281(-)
MNLQECVPEDMNGNVVPLNTKLGQIPSFEITFLNKGSKAAPPQHPPFIEDVLLEASGGEKRGGEEKRGGKDKRSSERRSRRLSIKINRNKIEPVIAPQPVRVRDMYEFQGELGNGAFSVVKMAKHKETGDVVAIKVLEKYEDDPRQAAKFDQEIEIMRQLDHPNIIKFHELDEDNGHYYVVMEVVNGGELFDQIVAKKYYTEEEAAPIVAQILCALSYLHDVLGIVHRDLKPENLLFKGEDHNLIKIADFGESKSYISNTLSTYCGTPDYMAPEIIKSVSYGAEVDMWAIGVITYVMLGGFPPFDGENDIEVFASILGTKYSYPSPEWDHVGDDGMNFIDSLLKLEPQDRLTAVEALSHPFIVKYSPESLRTPAHLTDGRNLLSKPRRK